MSPADYAAAWPAHVRRVRRPARSPCCRRPRQRGHRDLLPRLESRRRHGLDLQGGRDDHRRQRCPPLGGRRHGHRGRTGFVGATFTVVLAPASGRSSASATRRRTGPATSPADYAVAQADALPARTAQTLRCWSTATCSTRSTRASRSISRIRSTRSSRTETASARSPTTTRPRPWRSTTSPSARGNAGTVNATFTVALNRPAGAPCRSTSQRKTARRARARDYTAIGGSLEFAAGQTTKTVIVVNATCSTRSTSSSSSTSRARRTPPEAPSASGRSPTDPSRLSRSVSDDHRGRFGQRQRDLHRHAHARQRPAGVR